MRSPRPLAHTRLADEDTVIAQTPLVSRSSRIAPGPLRGEQDRRQHRDRRVHGERRSLVRRIADRDDSALGRDSEERRRLRESQVRQKAVGSSGLATPSFSIEGTDGPPWDAAARRRSTLPAPHQRSGRGKPQEDTGVRDAAHLLEQMGSPAMAEDDRPTVPRELRQAPPPSSESTASGDRQPFGPRPGLLTGLGWLAVVASLALLLVALLPSTVSWWSSEETLPKAGEPLPESALGLFDEERPRLADDSLPVDPLPSGGPGEDQDAIEEGVGRNDDSFGGFDESFPTDEGMAASARSEGSSLRESARRRSSAQQDGSALPAAAQRMKAHLERGRVSEAEDVVDSLEQQGTRGLAGAALGRGYLSLEANNPEAAVRHFRQAVQLGEAEGKIGAGLAHLALGDDGKARAAFTSYLRDSPEGRSASIARRQLYRLNKR